MENIVENFIFFKISLGEGGFMYHINEHESKLGIWKRE